MCLFIIQSNRITVTFQELLATDQWIGDGMMFRSYIGVGIYENRDTPIFDSRSGECVLTREGPQVCPRDFNENDVGLLSRVCLSQV